MGNALTKYFDQPARFLGTTLVGNNIALVIYGLMMEFVIVKHLMPHYLEDAEVVQLLYITVISTIIILIFGEYLPKSLFRLHPNGILNWVAVPFLIIYYLLWIPVWLVIAIAKVLLKWWFNINYADENKAVLGTVDLQNYVQESRAYVSENEAEIDADMFEKALDLSHIKVRECMVPRLEIDAVENIDDLDTVTQKFIETKHSKLMVYQDSIDQIIGYYHHQDILQHKKRLWKALVVPETMSADELLHTFIKQRKSMAWVVDEFGGTAGIVTLEDIIEEIFGEIRDEHDEEGLIEEDLGENTYRFSARLEIDYLNEQFNLDLPTGDYETLGGYIFANYEAIPTKGEVLRMDHFELKIIEVSRTRIEVVELIVLSS